MGPEPKYGGGNAGPDSGRIYVSHFRSTKVSIIPSLLISACNRMVRMVEPLAQRIHPSSRPNTKIWLMVYQSYCTWMSAHSSEVTTITGQTSRGERSQPRNRNPRNKISSPIGVNTTMASHSQISQPPALAVL